MNQLQHTLATKIPLRFSDGGRIIDLDLARLPELDTYMVRVRDILGASGDSPVCAI